MPYEIYPRVFFGNEDFTETIECQATMTHILNVTDDEFSTHTNSRDVCEFLHLYTEDNYAYPIMEKIWPESRDFIDKALHENEVNKVYIHCHMGINRSACIAVAYTAYKTKRPILDIIGEVRKSGVYILSNQGFIDRLYMQYDSKYALGYKKVYQ
jgi:Dual specificity phosphatase, catalytic domain